MAELRAVSATLSLFLSIKEDPQNAGATLGMVGSPRSYKEQMMQYL
jgi:hypothetical protein